MECAILLDCLFFFPLGFLSFLYFHFIRPGYEVKWYMMAFRKSWLLVTLTMFSGRSFQSTIAAGTRVFWWAWERAALETSNLAGMVGSCRDVLLNRNEYCYSLLSFLTKFPVKCNFSEYFDLSMGVSWVNERANWYVRTLLLHRRSHVSIPTHLTC